MIGKATTGKSFGGCIRYCLEDKKMKLDKDQSVMLNRAEVLLFNKCFGNKKELVQQFNEVRNLNPKQSRPVFHFTLSLAPEEQLTKAQMIDVALDCAQSFGFDENQFIAVEHTDTQHQHIHIIANRIGFIGKTNVSDSNSYKRMAEFCRKMEQKHQLQQVLSPKRFMPKELQQLPRNDKRKQQLKTQLERILKAAKTFENFMQKAKAQGLEIIKGRGISFVDEKGVKVKGSEMGLSLLSIQKQIEKNNLAEQNRENGPEVVSKRRQLNL